MSFRVYLLNPPAAKGVRIVREGRCMQREGAWTAVWTPISLALTASVLRQAGFEVSLNDCIVEELDFNHLKEKIREFKPHLVIINTGTPSIESDLYSSRVIKEVNPDIKTAAIGIHVTALPEESLRMEPTLDFIIKGEPEFTIKELAETLKNRGDLSKIMGLCFREGDKYILTPPRPPIEDLDLLPFPAWDLIQRDKYIMPFTDRQFLLVATGRGCPYQCVFCADTAYYGHKLHLRRPKSIVDEMIWDREQFGISDFLFWSESFTINQKFAMEVAREIIKRGGGFRWVCNSRVDNVSPELLQAFKKAGCWMIGYGIEVGNQKILDLMNKKTTLQQAKDAVRWAKEAGLEVTGHCILGYPSETIENLRETIDFAIELDLDFAQFYCVVPFPGSKLFTLAKENNWICSWDWSRWEQNYSVLNTDTLTADQIMKMRHFAYRKFYLRPKMILKTLKKIQSFSQLKNFLSMTRDFLTWI